MTPGRIAHVVIYSCKRGRVTAWPASAAVALVLLGGAAVRGGDRPPQVDHSVSPHFPPIGRQEIGDCTCWSSAYYYSTFTQARDEGRIAATGDPEVVCSPRFLFPLIAEGAFGAECTRHAMERLADVGCAPVALHPMSAPYEEWPTESARVAALRNRPGVLHVIRADDANGLEAVRQHIADGGCAVTRALFHENYVSYGDSAAGPGVSNRVLYAGIGGNYLRHSLCICGYDDERVYFDARVGQMRKGAFLIANSEGPDWGWYNSTGTGSRGFLWVAYAMFLEGEFGRYDHDDNPYVDPCYDNPPHPEVYFHDDRPRYRPRLYAAAGINHPERNQLTFTGGVGQSGDPAFLGPRVVQPTDFGALPIDDSRRVVVDLTDGAGLIAPGSTEEVFVALTVDPAASQPASITSVDVFYDSNGNGIYQTVSAGLESPAVARPGRTRNVSVGVTRPRPGDIDVDGVIGAGDFVLLEGCLAGPGRSVGASCDLADLSGDGDVDLGDLAWFQTAFVEARR